jgi:hypothetical protein
MRFTSVKEVNCDILFGRLVKELDARDNIFKSVKELSESERGPLNLFPLKSRLTSDISDFMVVGRVLVSEPVLNSNFVSDVKLPIDDGIVPTRPVKDIDVMTFVVQVIPDHVQRFAIFVEVHDGKILIFVIDEIKSFKKVISRSS